MLLIAFGFVDLLTVVCWGGVLIYEALVLHRRPGYGAVAGFLGVCSLLTVCVALLIAS
jgi:uncharacterized membrane protein